MSEKIDVIVPVYNEEECLEQFLERIRSVPLSLNLIFIDNASTDGTVETLEKMTDVTIIRHEENEGYGASICDGISSSRAEKIVIIDADCEYPPESIPELIEKLGKADAVYASRFLGQKKNDVPRLKSLGNKIITTVFNVLFNQDITDLYTGCKALRRAVLEDLELRRKGFEHVLEMGVLLSEKAIRIEEVAVDYAPRKTGHSKMRHLSETMKFMYLILYYRFRVKPGRK